MILKDLLSNIDYEVLNGNVNINIADLVVDSRKITKGCLFVCIKGAAFDSHDLIGELISNEVSAIIVDKDVTFNDSTDVTIIKVSNTRLAIAYISSCYYGNPSSKLRIIGITGTKGKTTTTYMIKQSLDNCGFKVGLIGTIETIIGDKHIKSLNTTPDAFVLNKTFNEMLQAGIDTVVMEVSSQALKYHRTLGVEFDIGVFTNLGLDHIGANEHEDFDDYLNSKALLFQQSKLAIGNFDDKYFDQIFKDANCPIITYGIDKDADFKASNVDYESSNGTLGISFDISDKLGNISHLKSNVPGLFSVYNLLCAYCVCVNLAVDNKTAIQSLLDIKVKGRTEFVEGLDNATIMIDYAHNAMALQSLLETIKEYNPKRIVTIFGCGGDRSKTRRFEMGKVSGTLSDFTIITSDNPRSEDPDLIIDDIESSISKTNGKYIRITDRIQAIKYAIDNAKDGDVIILAGKGHEDYQEINGVRHEMDERKIIKEILNS